MKGFLFGKCAALFRWIWICFWHQRHIIHWNPNHYCNTAYQLDCIFFTYFLVFYCVQAKSKGIHTKSDIGVKYAEKQQRRFAPEKLKEGRNIIGLQVSQLFCVNENFKGLILWHQEPVRIWFKKRIYYIKYSHPKVLEQRYDLLFFSSCRWVSTFINMWLVCRFSALI